MEILIPYNSLLDGSEGIFGPAGKSKKEKEKDHQKGETHLGRSKAKQPLTSRVMHSIGDLPHHIFSAS